jgi:hypothetical protein
VRMVQGWPDSGRGKVLADRTRGGFHAQISNLTLTNLRPAQDSHTRTVGLRRSQRHSLYNSLHGDQDYL